MPRGSLKTALTPSLATCALPTTCFQVTDAADFDIKYYDTYKVTRATDGLDWMGLDWGSEAVAAPRTRSAPHPPLRCCVPSETSTLNTPPTHYTHTNTPPHIYIHTHVHQ